MPSLPKPRRKRDANASTLAASVSQERSEPRIDTIEAGGLRWINISDPGTEELDWLGESFEFHALDLRDVLSRNERPKIDEYEGYLFIVLHFPVYDHKARRLTAGELDIFVGENFLITLPNRPIKPLDYLFERTRTRDEFREQLFQRGSGYLLYRIVDDAFGHCFPMLHKVGNKLDALEDEIFHGGRSEEIVRDIFNVKQEIINFRKVIRPQRPVLRDLEAVKHRYLIADIDLEIYFDDVVDAHERIWDMLENYKEVVEALEDTNESLISHRVNDVLRVLTSISVIVLPLTMVASVFGMNVGLPGGGDPESASLTSFAIVLAVMVAILLGMVAYFRRKNWL